MKWCNTYTPMYMRGWFRLYTFPTRLVLRVLNISFHFSLNDDEMGRKTKFHSKAFSLVFCDNRSYNDTMTSISGQQSLVQTNLCYVYLDCFFSPSTNVRSEKKHEDFRIIVNVCWNSTKWNMIEIETIVASLIARIVSEIFSFPSTLVAL